MGTKHIAWLDLETTGSAESDVILECGIVLTDERLQVVASNSWVIHEDVKIELVDPYVVDMHDKNGLWLDVAASILLPEQADDAVSSWLKGATKSTKHIALAGSGVGHFDRRYIKRYWPSTDKLFTYWALDVGVMRRFLKFAQREDLVPAAGDSSTKTHRALDDAQQHLDEAVHYMKWIETA